jgi:hypothetical protein
MYIVLFPFYFQRACSYSSGSPQMRVSGMAYQLPSGTVCVPPAPGCTHPPLITIPLFVLKASFAQVPPCLERMMSKTLCGAFDIDDGGDDDDDDDDGGGGGGGGDYDIEAIIAATISLSST